MSDEQIMLRHERIEAAAAAGNMEEAERLAAIPHTLAELTAEYATMPRYCRGPRSTHGDELVAEAFAKGDLEGAKLFDGIHRTPCGQDVNALILAAGVFGKDNTVACPRCSRPISYRAPVVIGSST